MAALSGYGQIVLMQNTDPAVIGPVGTLQIFAMIVSLAAGTMLLVWLGELITERGIGNGISIIIFGGIIAGLPQSIGQGYITGGWTSLFALIIYVIAIITFIVFVTEGHRRIPVQYAKSTFRGGKMYRQSGSTYIPLRVNIAGMIPLIFAMSIIMLPGIIASYFSGGTADAIAAWFNPDRWLYWLLLFFLVIGFTFFYTMIIFEQMNLADTLQKQGGFVPGIRPGRATETYLDQVLRHITWAGALFLALVAVLPFFAQFIAEVPQTGFMILSSAGLLIMVGVALDTMKQLEAQLLMRRYEGFLK
jgi:preprotein translocase subunit SecY